MVLRREDIRSRHGAGYIYIEEVWADRLESWAEFKDLINSIYTVVIFGIRIHVFETIT